MSVILPKLNLTTHEYEGLVVWDYWIQEYLGPVHYYRHSIPKWQWDKLSIDGKIGYRSNLRALAARYFVNKNIR